MVVLVICKYEGGPIKMKALDGHKIIYRFFRRSRADKSVVSVGILSKFEYVQAFIHLLVTCKN